MKSLQCQSITAIGGDRYRAVFLDDEDRETSLDFLVRGDLLELPDGIDRVIPIFLNARPLLVAIMQFHNARVIETQRALSS
jgi:hypothetical protein